MSLTKAQEKSKINGGVKIGSLNRISLLQLTVDDGLLGIHLRKVSEEFLLP